MAVSWLFALMIMGCLLAMLGGLGVHIIENYDGRRLEAYCRLRRQPELFGQVLDRQEQAFVASLYMLLFGLVVGSLAAGGWRVLSFPHGANAESLTLGWGAAQLAAWWLIWLFINVLVGLWLPQLMVRQSASLLLFHTWPFWSLLAAVASPLVTLGNLFSWVGQRLSDVPSEEDQEEEMLQDEIRTMVQAAQREGVVSDVVPEMIQGVMQLGEVEVAEIMTPRSLVDAIDMDQPWDQVLRQVMDCRRTRIPIYRNTIDHIVGILFVKDLLVQLAESPGNATAHSLEAILRKPWFIPGNKTVDELLRVFLHNRNHMAIVIDEYQQMMGVVTIEDALEEIVGEIADELDLEEDSQIVYDPETHEVEAEGKVPIENISKILGIELPESDDYDTIGGLVIHRLSEIPKEGTQVDVGRLRITVLRATKRMVQRVRLQVIGPGG